MHDTPRFFVGATTVRIGAMGSGECARAVIAEVAALPAVVGVIADLMIGSLMVTASTPLDRSEIAAAVERAGHAVVPWPALPTPLACGRPGHQVIEAASTRCR